MAERVKTMEKRILIRDYGVREYGECGERKKSDLRKWGRAGL
jgi:hypothetical protein